MTLTVVPAPNHTPRVRMESPDALFAPDYLVETPVPAPLYLCEFPKLCR